SLRLSEEDGNVVQATLRGTFSSDPQNPLPVFLDVRVPRGSEPLSARLRVEGVRPKQLAMLSPQLKAFEGADLPITTNLTFGLNELGEPEDFSGVVTLGAGHLPPLPRLAKGVPLLVDGGQMHLSYQARDDRLLISDLQLEGPDLAVSLEGQVNLERGASQNIERLGVDLALGRLSLPQSMGFERPLTFERGHLLAQAHLEQARLDIAQLNLRNGPERYQTSGHVAMTPQGPKVALSAQVDSVDRERALALWPVAIRPGTRAWVGARVREGHFPKTSLYWRAGPGSKPVFGLDMSFQRMHGYVLASLPQIEAATGWLHMAKGRMDLTFAEGLGMPPIGGEVDLAGSRVVLADMSTRPIEAEVEMQAQGSLTALLSTIDQPPLRLLDRVGRSPDMAQGEGRVTAQLRFPLLKSLTPGDVTTKVEGVLTDLHSLSLVKDRVLKADVLDLLASNDALHLEGKVTVNGVPFIAQLDRSLGASSDGAMRIAGRMPFSSEALSQLGVTGMPQDLVTGESPADVTLEFSGTQQSFKLSTSLAPLTLGLPALGW
ncbi:MAG: hypothetical protein AAGA78_11310, partial [Pseudomonadota bacterium]